jgi:long-chain acyl-CoA synthetase
MLTIFVYNSIFATQIILGYDKMAILKPVKTIPELFEFLTGEYYKKATRPLLSRKVNNVYTGISYQEVGAETELFACGLPSLGFKRDDKIAIIAENRPEWVYADMGIICIGGIDVPVYPSLTADSIEFILNNSEAKGVVVSNKFQLNKILKVRSNCRHLKFIIVMNEKDVSKEHPGVYSFAEIQETGRAYRSKHAGFFKSEIKKADENQVCTIIYTSGTTGEPKGVMLTHKNIMSNVKAALQIFPITADDTFLSFLPLCHIFERMAGYYAGFAAGSSLYFADSIDTVAQNLVEVKPTLLTTVPRLFEKMYTKIIKNVDSQPSPKRKIFYWGVETAKEYMYAKRDSKVSIALKAKYRLADKLVLSTIREKTGGRLRFFISGGAPLSLELGEFFEAVGMHIREGYGLTETSPVISVNRVDDFKFGTVGKPLPGVEVKIAPDGEILCRSAGVMAGYYKNPRETNEVIKDSWFHTGDIGHFDSEGFLVITDRKKHLFKTTAGKYIAPAHIENLFLASKYIDQFVLIGDKRTFLSALIVPDFEAIKEYADANNIKYRTVQDLIKSQEIYNLFDKEMQQFQKKLANYERIRKFTILDKPFTLETGEITPSLKVKRKVVEERYRNLIEEMYETPER